MQQYPDALFLTDDGSARFAALQLGFQVAGTVAMLIRAARTKQIPAEEVLTLLQSIPTRLNALYQAHAAYCGFSQAQKGVRNLVFQQARLFCFYLA